ncbi:MAG: PQQ-binding-like beta-propeller repeat protein [Bryobacteraceae bacterium]
MRICLVLVWAGMAASTAVAQKTAPADWPMYSRDFRSSGFSPLTAINPSNVTKLRQVCTYEIPEAVTFESSLVTIAGIMYFATPEYTYAVDAGTCALKWRVRHEMKNPGIVRGVAISGTRLFRGFRDGMMAAYDVRNGELLWTTNLTEPDGKPATIAASPMVWQDIVLIGTSGAERACGCIIAALDASTGKLLWTFALVPTGNAPGAETWPKDVHVGGGSIWTTVSIDPSKGLVYIPTGNPGPDFSGAYRPGANLYTGSVVVLEAKTGKLKTWYQLVPHDVHDYDQAAAPTLVQTKNGKKRAMAAGKDGFLHSIDTDSGKIAFKVPVTTIDNIEAPLTPEGTHFCPGTSGGVQWNGPAFSPKTNLVFVNSVDWCSTIKLDTKIPEFVEGKEFLGSAQGFCCKDKRKIGWVHAIDADSGAVKWKHENAAPLVAGIAVTASGIVFTGDLNGDLLAFDAPTGKILHRISSGQPMGGGVVTYEVGKQQRIAVAAGMQNRIFETMGKPIIYVYGL